MGDIKREQRGHPVKSLAEIDAAAGHPYLCKRMGTTRTKAQGTCSGLCDCPYVAVNVEYPWDATYHGPIKPSGPSRKAVPTTPPSNVNLPKHYARNKIEPVHFAVENGLDNFQFQINKYNVRAYHKHETPIEDIKKILRYAEMWLKHASGDKDWWKPSTMVIGGYTI